MDNPPLDREARAAMQAARQAAVDAGAVRANGPQILIATLGYPRAGALLELFAVDPATVRSGAQFIGAALGAGAIEDDSEERTIELAMAEARALAHAETGIEHVLLGIAAQVDSAGAAILAAVNVTLPHARSAVRFLHGELRNWEPPKERAGVDELPLTMTAPLTLDTSEEGQQLARALSERMSPFMDTEGDRLRRVVGIGQGQEQSAS
jgi:ATP-dependent Clp protease ATP-binding subunit ClpA